MRRVKELLRLAHELGYSKRQIAQSIRMPKTTVGDISYYTTNIGFTTGFDLADRQSRPSISSDIWARLIVTTPSAGLGQMNFPSVRRFCISRKPLPSYTKTLIVWAARPRKMKRWPLKGKPATKASFPQAC